jgi:hypothetical protein
MWYNVVKYTDIVQIESASFTCKLESIFYKCIGAAPYGHDN